VTYVLVGAVGLLLGLSAHDLAIQSLDDDARFRPLSGTCRNCHASRGWTHRRCASCDAVLVREPFIVATAVLASLAFTLTVGLTWELIAYLAFLLLTTALMVTDLESFRIVDRLNLPGSLVVAILLALTALLTGHPGELLRGLGGAAAYFAGATALFLIARGRGFGAGDVKLAPQLGLFTAYLGWGVLGWAVMSTALIGGVVALILVLSRSGGRDTELPYGPPMILGSWLAIALVGVGAIPVPS
jgi:leader peptidase (prepilin peptidase)/N-methyltransferase